MFPKLRKKERKKDPIRDTEVIPIQCRAKEVEEERERMEIVSLMHSIQEVACQESRCYFPLRSNCQYERIRLEFRFVLMIKNF